MPGARWIPYGSLESRIERLAPRREVAIVLCCQNGLSHADAAQVLACQAAWGSDDYARTEMGLDRAFDAIDPERLNVDGGAVQS